MNPDLQDLLLRAEHAVEAGCWEDAHALLEQGRRRAPRDPRVLTLAGVALMNLGRPEEALSALRRAVAHGPTLAEAHANLAIALSARGRRDEAIVSLGRAVSLAPGFARAWLTLAEWLRAAERHAEAERAYQAAIDACPDEWPAYVNLGALRMSLGRPVEALAIFEQGVRAAPRMAMLRSALGGALAAVGRYDEALDAYAQALVLDPRLAAAHYAQGCLQQRIGRAEEAIASFRAALALDPNDRHAADNLLLALQASDTVDRECLAAEHRRWSPAPVARPPEVISRRVSRPRDSTAPLRVGLVSADFRLHSVAFFLLPLLRHRGYGRLQFVCYSNHPGADDMTALLRAECDGWSDVSSLDDEQAAALIQRDAPDILVDLSGRTAGNRLSLFSCRPAAVQATWLGYPDTTGHPEIDWRIVDAITDPQDPAVDALATERLLRLPRCFVCHALPPELVGSIDVTPRPACDEIRFGSFNTLSKLTPTTVSLWSGVLQAVPDATLTLKAEGVEHPGVRARVSEIFAACGIDPGRLRFLARTPGLREHLERYAEVDIALDPFPYHGATTTCEALAMGVPVVSLAGDRHVSRVGASLLAAAGRAGWSADSRDGFIARAVELADEVRAGRQDRAALRRQVVTSALCDGPAFARVLGEALRALC